MGVAQLGVEVRYINQPNKSNYWSITHYFHFNIPFKQLYTSKKMESFSYKGGCMGTHVLKYLKEKLACTIDKQLQVISNKKQTVTPLRN